MRVLAVDHGSSRTGVALSDPTGTITGEAFTIHEKNTGALLSALCALCAERGVGLVVVGNPKHMNSGEGERSMLAKKFADSIASMTGLPVTMWDERLTSVDAHRILSENNRRGTKRKEKVDAVAASLILEGYLNSSPRNHGGID